MRNLPGESGDSSSDALLLLQDLGTHRPTSASDPTSTCQNRTVAYPDRKTVLVECSITRIINVVNIQKIDGYVKCILGIM